ncbi:hypothetical protein BAUCODRAFT_37566 [Baudoinia panamericana UAMH 10762]|uniref:Uncharacterized protein n=1 Tax=Baudoinia panamericana (strain UAMH 10762) TaxID=717646 RepID=M2MMM4_BAUPA|nr:uncharacterized protein BAUCODRAFT_37566 [Baudoinia panamericana UAMH 10762]EMC92663.1 hypothetical protein BAUCODRAFT_37566 [Baudoinia panamericana UAMH 10762]
MTSQGPPSKNVHWLTTKPAGASGNIPAVRRSWLYVYAIEGGFGYIEQNKHNTSAFLKLSTLDRHCQWNLI